MDLKNLPDGPMDVIATSQGTYGGPHGCTVREPDERFTISNARRNFSARWMIPADMASTRVAAKTNDEIAAAERLASGGANEQIAILLEKMGAMEARMASLTAENAKLRRNAAKVVEEPTTDPIPASTPVAEANSDDDAPAPARVRRRATTNE